MGLLNNNLLDDPPIDDETVNFSGGVYSAARKNELAANMLALAINGVIDKNGQAITRRGCSKVGTDVAGGNRVLGMTYLDTPTLERLVRVIQNGGSAKVQQHDNGGGAWADVAGFAPNVNAAMDIIPAVDRLYFLNGVDTPRNWDGTTWVTHGTSANDMPLASFGEWLQYRMFVAGVATAPDTVFFCSPLNPGDGQWQHVSKSFRVGSGEGDEITSLAKWQRTLLAVLKRSSLWLADVDPTLTLGSQIPLQQMHESIGCLSHRTVKRVGDDLFFLSDDGVRSLTTSMADKKFVGPAVSEPLKNLFARLNKAAAHTACAESFNSRYLIAFPIDNATQPNVVASYNADLKVWEGYWTGLLPTVFVRSFFGGLQRLNWGQSDGRTLQWRDWVQASAETGTDYQDDGVDIPTTFGLRSHNFREPKNDKKGLVLELEFDESRATAVTVTAYRDEASTGTVLGTITSGLNAGITFPITFPLVFPPQGIKREPLALDDLDPFRELAIDVAAPAGKLALRAARLTGFLDTMPIGR